MENLFYLLEFAFSRKEKIIGFCGCLGIYTGSYFKKEVANEKAKKSLLPWYIVDYDVSQSK
ncbi:hypothetical protein AOR01nite_24750 [Acetobacter orleanensis]|uniref:Uncharacterized protein n=1 Tax=Acetobacter orleanensis TaxID=104099 RepID=A0A4Y3TQC7_9PROT|nr:hypothetical protein Abol_033_012 [Acetobacter orleanensis JCM 7639]GEB83998.1 hypothetical protein AOR01nite_24750 [Acetobacter orleanensis]